MPVHHSSLLQDAVAIQKSGADDVRKPSYEKAAEQEEPSALAAEFSLKQVSRTVHQGGGFLSLLMGIR